jgi:hypothetical protein
LVLAPWATFDFDHGEEQQLVFPIAARRIVEPKNGSWSHSKPACSAPASSWSGDGYHPNGGSAEQLKLEVSQGFGAAASVEPPDLG